MIEALSPITGAPLITDGVAIKIESAPGERPRRPSRQSVRIDPQPTTPPPLLARQQQAQQDRRGNMESMINFGIGIAILIVVLVATYLIMSRS